MFKHGQLPVALLMAAALLCPATGVGQPAPQSAEHSADVATARQPQRAELVQQLVQKFGKRLVDSRYMEKNCEPVDWPGWEGLPTRKCRYSVTDKASGITKSAEVVLLNPTPEKVANWVVTACHNAGTTEPLAACEKLFHHIITQSGGQFPVAGVVYEDMEGDGYFKAYCFRDGVTAQVAGITHRTTATLSAEEIQASLTGPITKAYTYARIASTTPDMYKAGGGQADVGTNKDRKLAWPQVVGDLYRRAWTLDSNELINMRAKAGF